MFYLAFPPGGGAIPYFGGRLLAVLQIVGESFWQLLGGYCVPAYLPDIHRRRRSRSFRPFFTNITFIASIAFAGGRGDFGAVASFPPTLFIYIAFTGGRGDFGAVASFPPNLSTFILSIFILSSFILYIFILQTVAIASGGRHRRSCAATAIPSLHSG
jgi:hypothetical protein